MGLPVITYNSKTIEFPHDVSDIVTRYNRRRIVSRALARTDTIVRALDIEVACEFREMNLARDRELLERLSQWWLWATGGNAWTFSRDADEQVLGDLDAGMAADSASATTETGLAIVPGRRYVIRDDLNAMIAKAVTYNSGTGALVIDSTSDYAFAAGATIRSAEHWPGLILDDLPDFPEVTNPPTFFDIILRFTERR